MIKKILFRIGTDKQHRMRLGETGNLFQACYFKGKELGYDSVYFEWPLKVQFNNEYRNKVYFSCPKETMLPINFINRNDVKLEDYEKVVDLCEDGAFFENSLGLFKGNNNGFVNYLNKYLHDTGKMPVFHIEGDKVDEPYILFHIRIANWSEYRNPDLRIYDKVFNILKEKYGNKYKFWRIGEYYRRLDRSFDYVAPYFDDDLNKFLKIINNCSLFVCCESGPNVYSRMLCKPMIELEEVHTVRDENTKGTFHPDFWKEYGGIWGESLYDWADRDKELRHIQGTDIQQDEIIQFAEKWI